MMRFTLYDHALSANCYKVRFMASVLDVEYDRIAVEMYPAFEHLSQKMLALSPAGTLPIVEKDDLILTDVPSILVWLADHFDNQNRYWNNIDLTQKALIMQWLGFSRDLSASLGEARLGTLFNLDYDKEGLHAVGLTYLRRLEAHLAEQDICGSCWLVGNQVSIADVACFPDIALAPDMGIELDHYPSVRNWLYAIRQLSGFITMPGIHATHDLKENERDFGADIA